MNPRAGRRRRIRLATWATSAALFAASWLVLFAQLSAGADPGLARAAIVAPPSAPPPPVVVDPETGQVVDPQTGLPPDQGGAAPQADPQSAPAPQTTRQS